MAIGIASKCKINANIGNSSTSSNMKRDGRSCITR